MSGVELLPLPIPHCTYADHSYPAFKPQQMQAYARANMEPLRAEVERLMGCLAAANANHEQFERQWYLERDRAERLAEALIAWHKQATDKSRREREESPGHSHAVLGVWDSDNGKYAGVECAQCALWFEATRLRAAQDNDDA